MKNNNSTIQFRKLYSVFGLLLIATYFVSNSYGKTSILNNLFSFDIAPNTIAPDSTEDEEIFDDTIMYSDGKDIMYEYNDSLPSDSAMEGMRILPVTPGVINITLGSTTKTINRGIYGIHIGGMFDNSTLRNNYDGANDYAWQWLVDLEPEVLRFPSGSYSKFTHLLHDPSTGANSKVYGFNLFKLQDTLTGQTV